MRLYHYLTHSITPQADLEAAGCWVRPKVTLRIAAFRNRSFHRQKVEKSDFVGKEGVLMIAPGHARGGAGWGGRGRVASNICNVTETIYVLQCLLCLKRALMLRPAAGNGFTSADLQPSCPHTEYPA